MAAQQVVDERLDLMLDGASSSPSPKCFSSSRGHDPGLGAERGVDPLRQLAC